MVVKFALLPKQWERPKKKKKVLAVGPLVGSKTYEDKSPGIILPDGDPFLFIPEEEQDNLSALELALNNTDTQVVAPEDTKQRPPRNLLRYLRKYNKPDATLDEARDDEALPRHPSLGSLSRASSVPTKKKKMMMTETSTYRITLTALSLTGVTPTAALDFSTTTHKVKAYVRVVRKVSGLQMLPDTPRLLKSQRLLGAATTTVTWPTESSTLHMQSTPHYRHQLCLELGLVTPDGMTPLGTATFGPGTASTARTQLVPVDRVATASRLRQKLFLARKKATPDTVVWRGGESLYRLSRQAVLTVSYTVQDVASAPKPQDATPEIPAVAPSTSAAPRGEPDVTDDVPKRTMMPSSPYSVLSYVSDPLSCCSGDETLATTAGEREVTEDAPVAISVSAVPRRDIVFEDPVIFPDVEPAATTDEKCCCWCCGWFPLCCGGASQPSDVTVDEDTSDARMVSMLEENVTAVSAVSEEEEDPAIMKQSKGGEAESEMKLDTTRKDLNSASGADDAELEYLQENARVAADERGAELSPPAHPNCFMSCLGDEDVENLKYAYLTVEDDPSIPPIVAPEVRSAPSAGTLSHGGESNIYEDITVPASGGKKEIPPYGRPLSQSQLERVLDTQSSSISAEHGGEEETSNYTTSFSGTLPEEEGTGCFPCLAVISSEGEMSASISQYDSLSGMTFAEPTESLTNPEIRILPEADRDI
jgi:hypothetical protein